MGTALSYFGLLTFHFSSFLAGSTMMREYERGYSCLQYPNSGALILSCPFQVRSGRTAMPKRP